MSTNLIQAIINIVTNPIIEIAEYNKSNNRANSMGGSLEEYIKDVFAGTVSEKNSSNRNKKFEECFSYTGNQNNPPDAMIKGGDAIEVKKIEGLSPLALNSSYPKAKLYANSNMITNSCRNCETWKEKDIIYAVGVVPNNKLTHLCIVYGIDYAASEDIYAKIKTAIRDGVNTINGVEFAKTNELGRVNRVDPLGITYLRIRGMWGIENPFKVFDYIYNIDTKKEFNFIAIINLDKYNTFSNRNELEELNKTVNSLNIKDVEIKVPDNPAKLKKAKLISFTI
ncbi:MAG: NgoPII family restriction endonuclease [Eubacteriaceae bacterium]